ncbi:MAG: BMP family ABC transporter substrate-binding protein [Geminicoccaceae bacterium]|nr:BMP family ABC transporter substrate-binding protein [Geminicoccaceae bacterium]
MRGVLRRLLGGVFVSLCLVQTLPLALVSDAAARDVTPGVVYAVGEKFDRSFNESAYRAHERFSAAHGVSYLEYHPTQPAEIERAVDSLVRRGADHISVVGYYYAQPLAEIAPHYEGVNFTLIDAVAEAPNVRSVTFREEEGCFLVGMIAALASETQKVGFIAALDIPLLRKFIAGFEQGVRFVLPDIVFRLNFIGATESAFNDVTTAAELARVQYGGGVDVIFAGAGNANMGVFQVAADMGRLAIGVDANQNGLFPGTILTSMLKRVDVAVLEALEDDLADKWTPGRRSLGLAEGGVDWALDENNAPLITERMKEMTAHARKAIVDGDLLVDDGR